MEKLQEALKKAREQRGDGAAPDVTSRSSPSKPVAETSAPASETVWQQVPQHELDEKLLEKNRILATRASEDSTPFDILRTKVLLTMRKNGWRRLAVTSPHAACGKTTTACNLALGFVRQPDVGVMLFEFDLRRPVIARNLSLPDGPDISEMLSGEVSLAEQAQRFSDNVVISAARQVSGDPTSMLLRQSTHETLRQIEDDFDPNLMIFDLPPLLVSDDTRAFLKDVDCVLMVAKADATTVSQIDACEREIAEQTNVLGVVLNQCQHEDNANLNYGKY
ncbi:MAG: CpsD/CapB family tyrosine-protein kinase [Pseudomonadota bacterium]